MADLRILQDVITGEQFFPYTHESAVVDKDGRPALEILKSDLSEFSDVTFGKTITKPNINGWWNANDGSLKQEVTTLVGTEKLKVNEGMVILASNVLESTEFYWICYKNGAFVRYENLKPVIKIGNDVDEIALDYSTSVGASGVTFDIYYDNNYDANAKALLFGGKYKTAPNYDGYWMAGDGTWKADSTLNSTPKIPIREGMELKVSNLPTSDEFYWVFFDKEDNYVSYIKSSSVIVPTNAKYVALDYLKNIEINHVEISIVKGCADLISEKSSGGLHGYLVTAGDSLTDGAILESEYPDKQTRPTYGYLVANENNMSFLNQGRSGSTMCDITVNGVSRNGYCTSRITQIPKDVTHITLWFGWNDHAYGVQSLKDIYCQSTYSKYYNDCTANEKEACDNYKNWNDAFIGTENSSDLKTWYGAWNYTLNYIITNFQNAKVGVVIPFLEETTLANTMRTALIEICKKYGVPYIDAQDSNQLPTNGHSSGLSAEMQTFYKNSRTVDGLHYNEKGYQLLKDAFENWISRF